MSQWVDRHKKKQDAATVQQAVQALRNTIFVGIFVGGTSFLFAFSQINSIDPSNFQDFRTLIYFKEVRALIISVLLFCSFLNWALVVRHASELGYLIDSESEATRLSAVRETEQVSSARMSKIRQLATRMTTHFSFGFRFMYLSIPFAFMAAGPIALVVSTAVVFAFHIDNDYMSILNPKSASLLALRKARQLQV